MDFGSGFARIGSDDSFMKRTLSIGIFLFSISFSSLIALAQAPPALDIFTSPDDTFQFLYSPTYELLVGDRMLRATQGRHLGMPVCDFSTALACVIYPIEIADDPRFEAAGFSVNVVPGVTAETECLTYADQLARSPGEPQQLSSIVINERQFRHATVRKTLSGHSQAADFYRTFLKQKCYELRIAVSLSEESAAQRPSPLDSPENARAYGARESLKLILSSFSFKP